MYNVQKKFPQTNVYKHHQIHKTKKSVWDQINAARFYIRENWINTSATRGTLQLFYRTYLFLPGKRSCKIVLIQSSCWEFFAYDNVYKVFIAY